jgi:tRNA-specific 2-thiouridylase
MAERGRVVVGMSGGVDSAVAALLLKRQGYEVVGLFMKNWEDDDDDEYCSTRQDLIDAVSVAEVIGVEIEAVNFSVEYKDRVFASFLAEYSAGRTPNPDVLCNAEIKFKAFLDHAMDLGATRIATGHYARVREVRYAVAAGAEAVPGAALAADGLSRFELLRGLDHAKDQSYFLHRLDQAQLSRVLFPVGELEKTEVRRIAAEARLPNAAKKDSTGICFIGERPFREFLNRYLPREPGPIRTPDGKTVGEHIGLAFYTIGQRKGIGLGGRKGSDGQAWYVAQKDLAENALIVVQGHEDPLLLKRRLAAVDASWVSGAPPEEGSVHGAKSRYRQKDSTCRVTRVDGDEFDLEFAEPQWAVTPGQSAVLYDGEVCLGGGLIA